MERKNIIISIFLSLLLVFSTIGSAFAGADISVSFNTNTAKVGDTVYLVINITNTGPGDLSNVFVSAPVPAGLKFIDTATGTVKNLYNSTSGIWEVDNLKLSSKDGGTKTLNITAQVQPDAAGKTITANASYLNVTDSSGPAPLKSAQSQPLTISGQSTGNGTSNTGNATSSTGSDATNTYILIAIVVLVILAAVVYLYMRSR